MDIQRPSSIAKQRRRRQIAFALMGVVAVALITLGLSRLKPAAPGVDRSTVYMDTVKRGDMIRQVHGLGTLVPQEIRWIPALTDGRVERINVRPGAKVKADSVLVELSNPQVLQAELDAEYQLRAAEADYNSQKVTLESQMLNQKSVLAQANTDYSQAKMQSDTNTELAKLGVISEQALKTSKQLTSQKEVQSQIEKERLANAQKEVESGLAVQRAKIDQLKALLDLQKTNLDSLKIRAGTDGVLQELDLNGNGQQLQVGQQVHAGDTLAKVAQPAKLMAELKVAETQAKDIQLGQPASIDTHNGVVPGHVSRIDPAVQNGTVTVDVSLDAPPPAGARPDLSVDGTIDLEHLHDVLYVGRPAFGQENSQIGMFRLEPDGKTADRVAVTVGRSSVNYIEILKGLKQGDQVILSDMSRWDNYDRIRLE